MIRRLLALIVLSPVLAGCTVSCSVSSHSSRDLHPSSATGPAQHAAIVAMGRYVTGQCHRSGLAVYRGYSPANQPHEGDLPRYVYGWNTGLDQYATVAVTGGIDGSPKAHWVANCDDGNARSIMRARPGDLVDADTLALGEIVKSNCHTSAEPQPVATVIKPYGPTSATAREYRYIYPDPALGNDQRATVAVTEDGAVIATVCGGY